MSDKMLHDTIHNNGQVTLGQRGQYNGTTLQQVHLEPSLVVWCCNAVDIK